MPVIGINTWVWTSPLTDPQLPQLLDHVAELGFEAVELPLENLGDLTPAAVRGALQHSGLSAFVVGAMAPGRHLVDATAAEIRATQDYLRGCIDLAQAIGAPTVCGPFYSATGRVRRLSDAERATAYSELQDNLAPVVAHASAAAVTVGIEPLKRYETSLINTTAQALQAVAPLLGEALGLALDTYHLAIEERSSADAIRAAGDRLVHLQVCGNDRGAPGGDQTDWTAIATALREISYDGGVVIESFTADNAAIATAASIWRPLAASQDTLAKDGLRHLRRLDLGGNR